jgi:MULE transposase domain
MILMLYLHLQVITHRNSGGSHIKIICTSPGCSWYVTLFKGRGKETKGLWMINEQNSLYQHSPLCKTAPPRLGSSMVAKLPAVVDEMKNNLMTSVKTLLKRVLDRHGLEVNLTTMKRARNIVQGATLKIASAELLKIGQECHAFCVKNPGTRLIIEKSEDNVLQRVFICPAHHDKALSCMLSNANNDAMHCKSKEFDFQIYSTSCLTNQRSLFIYSIAILPTEDEANWTWYMERLEEGGMGRFLESGDKMLRGDREKGEDNAAKKVFPNTPKGCCQYHLRKNMVKHHLFDNGRDTVIWTKVAQAMTKKERDDWWEMLVKEEPKQAEYLQKLDPIMWQTYEQLQAGVPTHDISTNNNAEQVCAKLMRSEVDELPIRMRTPAPMIRGILEMFCEQGRQMRETSEKVQFDEILYSDYALSIWCEENFESRYYSAVRVGPKEFAVRRTGIITDVVRHVSINVIDGEEHAICECNKQARDEVMCRHGMAVASSGTKGEFKHLCKNAIGKVWLNSTFIEAFSGISLVMPSPEEIHKCDGSMFPNPLLMPAKTKKTRGRPQKNRQTRMPSLKRKIRKLLGIGKDTRTIHCTVCGEVGHNVKACPVRRQHKKK